MGHNGIKSTVMLILWLAGLLYFKFNLYSINLSMNPELKRKERGKRGRRKAGDERTNQADIEYLLAENFSGETSTSEIIHLLGENILSQ